MSPKKKPMWIVAARTDGLGARMYAVLNAMVIAKLTGLEFKFAWCAPENAPYMSDLTKNLNNNQVLMPYANLPLKEQFLSADFIAKSGLDDSYIGNTEEIAAYVNHPPLSLKDYTQRTSPEKFGWYCVQTKLNYPDLEESEYRRLVRESFWEIPFTPRIKEVMQSAQKGAHKLDFVAVHIRSGDVVFADTWGAIVCPKTALPIYIAMEMIRKELEQGNNVVCFSEDVSALKSLKKVFTNTKGGKFSSIEDFMSEQYLGYERSFFEIVFMSHAKRVCSSGSSGFSGLAMRVSAKEIEHKTPDDYFSTQEQVEILERNLMQDLFHPAHRAFACMKLILLGQELGRDVAYFKRYAILAAQSYPNHFYQVLCVYYCLLDKDFKEANRILEQSYGHGREEFIQKLLQSTSFLPQIVRCIGVFLMSIIFPILLILP